MERRISERKFVDVNVYVSLPGRRGRSTIRCTASDISSAGVFLKTNPRSFRDCNELNLVFALNLDSSNVVQMRKVPAIVTRHEPDGIGMVFCKNED